MSDDSTGISSDEYLKALVRKKDKEIAELKGITERCTDRLRHVENMLKGVLVIANGIKQTLFVADADLQALGKCGKDKQ